MKRWLFRLFLLLVLVIVAVGLGGYWLVQNQGADADELAAYEGATVTLDEDGIPTIEGKSWEAVVEAQGYVTASQRFFHMDLIRRASSGRLAELFGAAAVPVDKKRRLEDWSGVADAATAALESKDRALLDAYARGVNRFLESHEKRVSLEYLVLGVTPEPWSARDTMFIVLIMSEQLATAAPGEAVRQRWRETIGDAWFGFLFPTDHPWNEPLFGAAPVAPRTAPEAKLPAAKVMPEELTVHTVSPSERLAGLYEEDVAGWGASNSWAWCGGDNCYLANDPHLAASVPHLWFLNRLRVSEKEWAVGVSIPGAPGIVLGMNPYLAWAFTNVGEDVDDFLLEEISGDGKQYVEAMKGGEKIWSDVIEKVHRIDVKGGESVSVTSRHTSRGPIQTREHLGDGIYARRWLPLQPGVARPSFGLVRAKSWDEFNAALDEMQVPAQNALMVDRRGNIGYRATGTGIVRNTTGRFPQDALTHDWAGYQPVETRPRMLYYVRDVDPTASDTKVDPKQPRFIATANERIWADDYGHKWTEDLRKDRIRTVLQSKKDFTREEMEALQLDTHSRYHRMILQWLAEHAAPTEAAEKTMVDRWSKWSGEAKGHTETFTEAIEAERLLLQICIGRVRQHLAANVDEAVLPYTARLDSAWVIDALEGDDGFLAFGLDSPDLAKSIVSTIASKSLEPYPKANRWQAQHGFVGRVPVVGDWYKVPEIEQIGWSSVPRVERPKFGASTRMVWDLRRPLESTWVTPVGQSGHPMSANFSDLAKRYHEDRRLKVFEDGNTWWFAPQGATAE